MHIYDTIASFPEHAIGESVCKMPASVKKKLNSINALGGSCAGISKERNVIYLKLLPP